MHRTWFLVVAGVGVVANAQTLTPREIFYSQRLNTAAASRANGTAQPVAKGGGTKAVDKATSSVTASSGPQSDAIRQVSLQTRPLALRYSLLRQDSNGNFGEADPKAQFISGDRVRLVIESSDTAYLYVVSQGSSGVWKVLYPAPSNDANSNRVVPTKRYDIPGTNQTFTFNDQAGEERLFVILARKPEPDLEKLVHSLSQQATTPAATPTLPSGKNSASQLAENLSVKDDVMDRFRVLSRDLVVETVTVDAAPQRPKPEAAAARENAVYVVNPKAGEDGRVVADIRLIHR
jgi:hypothetical protein